MMKKVVYFLAIAAAVAACNSKPAAQAGSEQAVVTDTSGNRYILDTGASVINWTGEALSYAHFGTIKMSGGSIVLKDGNVTSGSFTIDLRSIKDIDLTDPEKNSYLVGHLNDTDFFNTKKFPTGKFEITGVTSLTNDTAGNTHAISGNLTLKGVSRNITFPAKVTINSDMVDATGSVMINRLDWDIKYHSTTAFPSLKAKLKDNAIKDEMKVTVNLKAKKG
jgi:polyisoprenoid-binding protein YceI